jgi:hypothetical protein
MVWNINGSLGLKIRDPEFLRSLTECDIALLLETWLHPLQEDNLPLPRGFVLVARSRPLDTSLGHQWGGVAALLREDIPLTVSQGRGTYHFYDKTWAVACTTLSKMPRNL